MTGNSKGHGYLLGEKIMNDIDNQQKRLMEIGWLVGIIEGEGCFTIQKRQNKKSMSYTPLIQITNINPEIILKASRIIKELQIPCYIYLQKQGDYKLCYRIVTLGIMRVKKFLDVITPYIECRQEQLQTLATFVNSRLSRSRGEELNDTELEAISNLSKLNRPYLFSETARSPLEIPEKIQSELAGNSKVANYHKQRLLEEVT